MKLLYLLFILILFFDQAVCQTASTNAIGRVNVIQPLSITSTGGALDFGEIVLTGSTSLYQLSPTNGKFFRIIGNPGRSVTISFNQVTLNNSNWATTNGGALGTLLFSPQVVNNLNSPIINGNAYPLQASGSVAILDIRVGGAITVNAAQPQGDYTGIFIISVSY